MAEQVTSTATPAALDDLDAPYRVLAVMPEDRGYRSGRQIGTWKDRVLLAWPK